DGLSHSRHSARRPIHHLIIHPIPIFPIGHHSHRHRRLTPIGLWRWLGVHGEAVGPGTSREAQPLYSRRGAKRSRHAEITNDGPRIALRLHVHWLSHELLDGTSARERDDRAHRPAV